MTKDKSNRFKTQPNTLAQQQVQKELCLVHNLKQHMTDNNISPQVLSAKTGISKSQIEKILNGDMKPSRLFMQALCTVPELCITYKDLLVWSLLDDTLKYANDNHQVLKYAV